MQIETIDDFIQKHEIGMRSKGNSVFNNCDIKLVKNDNHFAAKVESQSNGRKHYTVTLNNDGN